MKTMSCPSASARMCAYACALTVASLSEIPAFAGYFTNLYAFKAGEGRGSGGLHSQGKTLFGTTYSGGSHDQGTVFRIETNGGGFQILHSFTNLDGANPSRYLFTLGQSIYGSTYSGGSSGVGVIFKINTNGTDFDVLREFSGTSKPPLLGLVWGTTLFGTTYGGGNSNSGTIFQMDAEGGDFLVIKHFTGGDGPGVGDGAGPSGPLVEYGGELYGATVYGGPSGRGVIFKIKPDGTGYTILKEGNEADGGHFTGGLALSGTTLFGVTPFGAGGIGGIYSLGVDGGNYRILQRFNGFNGVNGSTPVISGDVVFVALNQGGLSNYGTVLGLSRDGSRSAMLRSFNGADGCYPGGLVADGSTLYGIVSSTNAGGSGGIFRLSSTPQVSSNPQSQTAEVGSSIKLLVLADSAPPVGYRWHQEGVGWLSDGNSLVITNLKPSHAGVYTVVVTNPLGAATSEPAFVAIVPAVPRTLDPGVILNGPAGVTVHLESVDTPSFTGWAPLSTTLLTGSPEYYFDPPPVSFRAFRFWETNAPLLATIQAALFPALRLTGQVGEQLRIDAIPRIGPVTNWSTLATVVVTNSPQTFYDLTAPGQPTRIYRVVPVSDGAE